MIRNLKISTKIFALIFVIVCIVIAIEVVISYFKKRDLIHATFNTELNVVADVQVHNIDRYFDGLENDLENLQSNPFLIEGVNGLLPLDLSTDSAKGLIQEIRMNSILPFQNIYKFDDVAILNNDGKVLMQEGQKEILEVNFSGISPERKLGFHHNQIERHGNNYYCYASIPIESGDSVNIGIILCRIDMYKLIDRTIDKVGLGETGEILIGKIEDGTQITHLYSSKLSQTENFEKNIYEVSDPIFMACNGDEGFAKYIDYDNNPALAVYKPISSLGLGIVVKINTQETYGSMAEVFYLLFIKAAILVLVSIVLGILFTRRLTRPILKLKKFIDQLKTGDLPDSLTPSSRDEVGEMTTTLNSFITQLKLMQAFAIQIGKGDYQSAILRPLSDKDKLSSSLNRMKKSLADAGKQDAERNWLIESRAEIGDHLRSAQNVPELSDRITEYICERLRAREAIIYTLEEKDGEPSLLLTAAFANGKKKHLKRSYLVSDNALGQCVLEKAIVFRTELDVDFEYIKSGDKRDREPRSYIIVPIIAQEKVIGIMSCASDKKFARRSAELLTELGPTLGQEFYNINSHDQTVNLLEEIQNAQDRLTALLSNASEIITIYNSDGMITYVSPSVGKILGYKEEELIGHEDALHINLEYQEEYKYLFRKLMNFPDETHKLQFACHRKDGSTIWLEATGVNRITDPSIKGVVINLRDITEQRRAEEEEKKKGQMQALSENSLDLITRVSRDGQLFYVNPVIESLSGHVPDDMINKKFQELSLDESITNSWKAIISEVRRTGEKVHEEMDFPTDNGNRVMHVNAIPEFSDDRSIDSVLMVSHDITERKAIETEIKLKNQKIAQSINYAERIQTTILPDDNILEDAFKEAFMFYRPRDVVSGDFPWFFRRGDNVYLAAVDCTGHGVPGALISIIGFFLLNEAAISNGLQDTGAIMDLLDELVTETFKQNSENAQIKDGMDIAFLRYNAKKGELQYSGAHRPLYYIKKGGELQEIKGDKFPIGGGNAYKNKTNFTQTLINLEEGDTVYFFSDGFPDQFGGPKNRKYGGKQLKRVIQEINERPMYQIKGEIERQYIDWKGDTKQTDDILLFALRF